IAALRYLRYHGAFRRARGGRGARIPHRARQTWRSQDAHRSTRLLLRFLMHCGYHDDPKSGGSLSQPEIAGIGHNHVKMPVRAAQWQGLHGDPKPAGGEPCSAAADLDLVESAFAEGFLAAGDPTSFLRLARVPFQAATPDGVKL